MNPTIEESRRRQAEALARMDGREPEGGTTVETTKPDFYALSESGRPVAQLVLANGADAADAAISAARNGWKVRTVAEIDAPRDALRERQRAVLAELTGGSDASIEAALPGGGGETSLPVMTVHRQPDGDRFKQELKETSQKVEAVKRTLDGIEAKTGKPKPQPRPGQTVELREVFINEKKVAS